MNLACSSHRERSSLEKALEEVGSLTLSSHPRRRSRADGWEPLSLLEPPPRTIWILGRDPGHELHDKEHQD